MSSLETSFKAAEMSLAQALEARRAAIDDATGKGAATELLVEEQLLRPHLPPHLRCGKGAIVAAANPTAQSGAIDRVVYDISACSPLLYEAAHSIFPIEAVCGLVEITMRLDAGKLREDIVRMAPVKAMCRRRFLESVPGSTIRVQRVERETISPRSFVVGLPADPNWDPHAIAKTLRDIQLALGSPTHVHGLYVIGRGYFETISAEGSDPLFRVRGWLGEERLFRFTTGFRESFDRWGRIEPGISADLETYVPGQARVLAE